MLKYTLMHPLGEGGMGQVYLATAYGVAGFQRLVAIKLMHDDLRTPELERMFEREAKLSSSLVHPNIVQTLDFDRDESGRPFMVMELVQGVALTALTARGQPSVGVVLAIFSQLLEALSAAHHCDTHQRDMQQDVQSIVHKDVSPQNILLTREGILKLADFGLAHGLDCTRLTHPGAIRGKSQYMSPEQARGEDLDARTDVFSAGIVLWELLTGESLFVRSPEANHFEVLRSVLEAPIPPPSSRNPNVSEALDAYCLSLLERDLGRRPTSASPAKEALRKLHIKPDTRALIEILATFEQWRADAVVTPASTSTSTSTSTSGFVTPSTSTPEPTPTSARASTPTDETKTHAAVAHAGARHATKIPKLGSVPKHALALLVLSIGFSIAAILVVLPKPPLSDDRDEARSPFAVSRTSTRAASAITSVSPSAPSAPSARPPRNQRVPLGTESDEALRQADKATPHPLATVALATEVLSSSASKPEIESVVEARRPALIQCFKRHVTKPRAVKVWFVSTAGELEIYTSPQARRSLFSAFEACIRNLELQFPRNQGTSFDVFALTFEPRRKVL